MCIGLGMYTDLTIDGTYVTLEIVLSKSQSYFWLENVIIIFNILWPLVVTSIFIKITFEQFKKLQDKYEHLKYLKNSIIAFKAKQESLPRKNFNDLIYSRF